MRTTEDRVRNIGKFSANTDLMPFIESASAIIDDLVASQCGASASLSESKLELLEMWLAAHYAAVSNPRLTSKSIAGASSSFASVGGGGEGLKATPFGTQLLALDTSGCLEDLMKPKARIEWVGTDYTDHRYRRGLYE